MEAKKARAVTKFEHSQVARNRRARRGLCRHIRRAVLVGITEAGTVGESEGVRIVEQCVEDGTGVKDDNLIEITVLGLEGFYVSFKLRIVVRKGRGNRVDCPRALFEYQGCAVCWWNC